MQSSTIETVARSAVQKLVNAGFEAYFAGGWVRDHLLNLPCNDIDIATSATPDQVMQLFPKTVPVGLAFGSVIVVEEGHPLEVTTFRTETGYADGRRPDEIAYASAQEDANRRGLTINGMFYNPLTDQVLDFVGGQDDLRAGLIRAIGDPQLRFREDKLRMIRAVRFAVRFNFAIEPATRQAICEHAHELFPAVAIERVWQEFEKIGSHPHFAAFLIELQRVSLLPQIFPSLVDTVIEERLAPLQHIPPQMPTILKLAELFKLPNERLAMCERLKVSNRDRQLIERENELELFLANPEPHPADWAHFYALEEAPLLLTMAAARLPATTREAFMQQHALQQEELQLHINRIRERQPVVTATHLREQGIQPGKTMGELLHQAERLAIAADLNDAEVIIKLLKSQPNWP